MKSITVSASALVAFLALQPVASGHHSHANYLEGEWTYIEGTVTEVHWMNPHSWIYVDVMDDSGQANAWAIEGASVTQLRRDGWAEDSIQIGDALKMRCHPLKDGSRGCLLGFIVMDDGSEKEFD
jgi:hypothetical protein